MRETITALVTAIVLVVFMWLYMNSLWQLDKPLTPQELMEIKKECIELDMDMIYNESYDGISDAWCRP